MYARLSTAENDVELIHEIHDEVEAFRSRIAALVGKIDRAGYYAQHSEKTVADNILADLRNALDDWTEDDLWTIAQDAQEFISRRGAA